MADTTRKSGWELPFFTIWLGQAFSLLGSRLVQFALAWWLTAATGSATVLATATLAAVLPEVLLGPLAGACVDRWSRRLVMIGADALVALATLSLALLHTLGAMQVWHIYAILVVRSVGGVFHWPAMQASTSLMVPPAHLARIAGLNQSLHGALSIVAPALGALLVGLLPLHGVLAIDVGTAVLALLPLTWVAIPRPGRSAQAAGLRPSLLHDLREGLRYVWGWPGMCLLGVVATLVNMMLTPAFSLLPLLVTKHFGGQALQLSWVQSATGLGIILGGLFLSAWGGFRRRMVTSLVGILALGVATLLVGLAPPTAFLLALAAMFFCGFAIPIANGPLQAIMQATVAPDMQGRVFALLGAVSHAAMPLGLLAAGPLADAFGVSTWFVIGGAACLLMGLGISFVPAIMRLEDGRQPSREQAPAATTSL